MGASLDTNYRNIGIGIVQANVAKNAANKAAEVQMASMQANADIQLGQQTMISNMGSQCADVASAGGQATVDVVSRRIWRTQHRW